MNTLKKYLRIDKKHIYFLNFLIDAYDGIARVKTINAKEGIVLLNIAQGCEEDVDMLIADISKDIKIEQIEKYE